MRIRAEELAHGRVVVAGVQVDQPRPVHLLPRVLPLARQVVRPAAVIGMASYAATLLPLGGAARRQHRAAQVVGVQVGQRTRPHPRDALPTKEVVLGDGGDCRPARSRS